MTTFNLTFDSKEVKFLRVKPCCRSQLSVALLSLSSRWWYYYCCCCCCCYWTHKIFSDINDVISDDVYAEQVLLRSIRHYNDASQRLLHARLISIYFSSFVRKLFAREHAHARARAQAGMLSGHSSDEKKNYRHRCRERSAKRIVVWRSHVEDRRRLHAKQNIFITA